MPGACAIRLAGKPSGVGSNPPALAKLAKSCCVKPKRVVTTVVGETVAVNWAFEPWLKRWKLFGPLDGIGHP